MLALHDPNDQLNGLGRLWMPQPYVITTPMHASVHWLEITNVITNMWLFKKKKKNNVFCLKPQTFLEQDK